MLSMQCVSYSSVLKTQLKMFSKCAQYKNRSRPERRRNCLTGRDKDVILEGILWRELHFFELTADAMLAFSHPFVIWRFPSQLVRWLYKLTSQVACKGLITESLRSTSISSLVTPDCIWVWISLVYQLVNWLNYKQKRARVLDEITINDRLSAATRISAALE